MDNKKEHNSFGKDFFDGKSDREGYYEEYVFLDLFPVFYALAVRLKDLFNPKNVLDLGCAKGFLVYAFRKLGIECYGVDISEYAISNAPEEVQPYLYKLDLNKDNLPFEDDSFDLITFLGTIEYLHNHRHTLSEIKRVLNPGRHVYLTTINYHLSMEGNIMKNVHERSFWIKEFDLYGFELEIQLIKNCIRMQADLPYKSIKSNVGRMLSRIPGIGNYLICIYLTKLSKFETFVFQCTQK